MKILAIDTTVKHFSFSYQSSDNEIYQYIDQNDWQHAELLLEMLRVKIPDLRTLTHLALSRGPGSFTGQRIGLAIAKAFKIALPEIQIITPTHFQIMAHMSLSKFAFQSAMVVIDAKRGELVAQKVDSELNELGNMINFPRDELKNLDIRNCGIIITDSNWFTGNLSGSHFIEAVTAHDVLKAAIKLLELNNISSSLDPIYFRPSDARPMSSS